MALSSSYDFTLTGTQLIAAAHRKLGITTASTTQNTNALQALEIILKALSAEGFNLVFPWTQEWTTQALTESTASYTLNPKIVEISEAYIRRSSNDTPVTKINKTEYAAIGTKSTEGLPNQMWIDKQNDGFVVYLYPVPENSTDVLHYLAVNKLQDMDSAANNIDINSAWFRALTYMLAADLGPEPGINAAPNEIANLFAQGQAHKNIAMNLEGGQDSIIIRRRMI